MFLSNVLTLSSGVGSELKSVLLTVSVSSSLEIMPLRLGQSGAIAAVVSFLAGYFWLHSSSNLSENNELKLIKRDFALLAALAAVATIVACYSWLRLNYPTYWQDLQFLHKLVKWHLSIKETMRSGLTILDVFENFAREQPDHPCILYKDETYTYAEVEAHANRVARWVTTTDPSLKKGDVVCLLLHNGPTFAWTCLGLMKAGIVSSLLNYNLKPAALLHCIQVSDATKVIFDSELFHVIKEILPKLEEQNVETWMVVHAQIPDLKAHPDVVTMDTSTLSSYPYSRDALTLTDLAIYIFTSGTTGMPKPVIVLHQKIIRATYLHFFSDLTPDDVYYVTLPMYHSTALLQATFAIWYKGGTVAIAKKFSAPRFWDDIRKYKATGFQYIGELCRYLLAQPKKENDGVYPRKIRVAQGNGLRPEIWQEFQERFKVDKMLEMYAATEGNFGFINIDGKVGAVGRYPWFLKAIIDTVEIVDYDFGTGEPKRSKDGFCILVPKGQTGLALHKINEDSPYTGYKGSKEMSASKIVRVVKKTGDIYFNTGDLLMIDNDGYVYFKDRLGDTFRWKGENVSTMEVSQVLSTFPAVMEANVYGVKVPGQDGRAGMAAIVVQEGCNLDFTDFYTHVTSYLPTYAFPKFIRVMNVMHITCTFKHKKNKLVEQGFDIDVVEDRIYIIEPSKKTYIPMNDNHMKQLADGQLEL